MSKALSVLSGVAVIVLLTVLGGTLVSLAGSESRVDPLTLSSIGTAFSYQGYLTDGQDPANGSFDFTFSLYDDPEVGNQVGTTISRTLTITDGLFFLEPDFGSVFDGTALWLEIRVRPAGDTGPYTTLLPRQRLTPAPFATFATLAASTSWAGLTDVPGGFDDDVDDDTLASLGCAAGEIAEWNGVAWDCAEDNVGTGSGTTYSAGAGLILSGTTFAISPTYQLPQTCDPNEIARWNGSGWECAIDQVGEGVGWSLIGNSGTVPGTNFLGTTDNAALELRVSASRALLLEPGSSSPNLIGGYSGNAAADGVSGATIGGGGRDLVINQVTADFGAIGGGAANTASGYAATIGGGEDNHAGGAYATAGGGYTNTVSGGYATIGGGASNTAENSYATVGGGADNVVTATSGTIAGGLQNYVGGSGATIGGGRYNSVAGTYGTIAGGGPSDINNPTTSNNQVFDDYGTISGGGGNVAGDDDGDHSSRTFATVGGGKGNAAGATYATVGGGSSNEATGYGSVVGGGTSNVVTATYSTVSGGLGNVITATYSTVAGGRLNKATGSYATTAGGGFNQASAGMSTVGGGGDNTVTGNYGTIPGGYQNRVGGQYSFAAGYQAHADDRGSFVWSDATGPFTTTAPNQFLIDAAGGVGIGTNAPSHMLTVEGSAAIQSSAVISVGAIVAYTRTLQAPRALYAVGDLLYAAGYATNTLSIWNVQDPTAQTLVGYTTFQLEGPVDLQVVGNRAYLASQKRDMLTILDVSDPADISHVGDTTEYLDDPQGVHVSGKYAYVASMGSNGRYDGLTVFDVTDAPAEIAATSFVTTYLQGTSDVFVVDNYAYVTSRYNNRLVVYDVSDPGDPTPASYTAESLIEPVQVHVSGIYAYVVDEGANTVVSFDVSNPAQITYVGQIATSLTHPRSLYVSGDRAYVAYTGDAITSQNCGLAVLDISDPADIAVLNVIDMSDWLEGSVRAKPSAVTGSGDRIYVANESHHSVYIFEIDGLQASAVRTGELQVAHLEVADYAAIEGDLGVRGGLNVGPGGALIQGALSVEGTGDSYIQGRLGIGPVATVITRSVSPSESEEIVMPHPTHQLDVDGEARFRVNEHNHLVLRSRNTGSDEDAYIDFVDFAYPDLITPSARIEFDAADPLTHTTSIRFSTQAAGDSQVQPRVEIAANGNLRPSVDNQNSLGESERRWTEVFAVNGTIQTSDGRLKENVAGLPYGLSAVRRLRPVAFTWKDSADDRQHYGLIAQEVAHVLPDLVMAGDDAEGTLGMNYAEVVPVLVKAIQEQQEEIDTQAEQIAGLEARLAALEDGPPGQPGAVNPLTTFGFGGLVLGAVFLVAKRRNGGRS